MENEHKNYLLISVVLLLYTFLLVIPVYTLNRDMPPVISKSLILPLLGICTLFVIVLYIVIRLHDNQSRSRISDLEEKLEETEHTRSSAEQGYQQ